MSSTTEHSASSSRPTIAIIGAGAGGLAFAIALKQKLGYENFVIYEKASDVGGTWRDNTYPGCTSDVSTAFYSLSTDLHDWNGSHTSQEELQNYWRKLTKKYGLLPHISFNHHVVSVDWNAASNLYHLVLKNTISGDRRSTTAHIVVSAIGILEVPRFANIPGVKTFQGEMFHSARWNKSVDLKGKRVAVIGNGASATQFVPIISEDPSVQITQFCRTPNWYVAPTRFEYSNRRRWLLRNIPFLMRLQRWSIFMRLELVYFFIFKAKFFRPMIKKVSKTYIHRTAPKKYHEELIPDYPVGCKRILIDTHYLAALHRPNLVLNWEGIESIAETGIITKKGDEIPFDVLIFATGYAADSYPIPVRGTMQTIQEYYEAEKGPKAYLGTTIPGFPNFFTIFGPNTATGHTSVIYTNEVQVNYIIQLIQPILARKVSSVEVKTGPTDKYNDKIHARLSQSVFTQCLSWYRVGGEGKITNIFPGAATTFWLWLRKPNWDHYTGVGMEGWRSLVKRKQRLRQITLILMVSLCEYLRRSPHKLVGVSRMLSNFHIRF
ncbi:hypothetical protein BDQ12DRAFT_688167 [Crucibulum laeve]|uniref:Monooxygenase n=1 Tax=Crucibulum laeve TaxID=68775 RepID=A0A5C3LRQ6_9AGAR|nr:hypothetical protein BDQ12DRAFT_688167 [Crucibulum laeve]